MREFIESGAARIAAGMQSVGANFDYEVLSLPGGTWLAVLLWIYASTLAAVKRVAPKRRIAPPIDLSAAQASAARRGPSTERLPARAADAACVGCGCG
jgi:hypothetical protein